MKKLDSDEIVLDVRANSSHWDPIEKEDRYECAVVAIDRGFAKIILERMNVIRELRAHDEPIYDLRCWDNRLCYYPCLDDENCEKQDESDHIHRPDFSVGRNGLRTEIDLLHIGVDSVHWTSYIKHVNVQIETAYIDRSVLMAIARGKKVRALSC